MFILGHIGITAGVYKVFDIVLAGTNPASNREMGNVSETSRADGGQRRGIFRLPREVRSWIRGIDYRLVLVGSILPDIIDKPVFLLFGNTATLSGRDYAHTLLFTLVLLIGGLVLLRYRRSWLLTISLSTLVHLILDQMWSYSVILLWPLLGPLPGAETADWTYNRLFDLLTVPEIYIPEITGLVILLILFYRLVRKKEIIGFITGALLINAPAGWDSVIEILCGDDSDFTYSGELSV